MAQLICFHDHAIFVVVLVISFVSFMLTTLNLSTFTARKLLDADELETI